jgi:hypothetical protein
MSRFTTDEMPPHLYKQLIDGLLNSTIESYRKEVKEKFVEIEKDIKEEKINSNILLRKMYKLSLVYKKLFEKLQMKVN